jgi:hypothetical protein
MFQKSSDAHPVGHVYLHIHTIKGESLNQFNSVKNRFISVMPFPLRKKDTYDMDATDNHG